MNGISLLLLLTTLSATTAVESGRNGQPVYTIRIESLLVNEMRNGQSIPIIVAARDRGVRYFKIAVTPDGNVRSSTSPRYSQPNSRAGDFYNYEPVQHETGEIEYIVQLSPEGLESLAKGTPIEGEVAADIPEVHRYLIFVGVGQLPSQQRTSGSAPAYGPALLTGNESNLRPAGAEVRATDSQSRISAPSLSNSQFQTGTGSTTSRTTDPLTQFNSRTADLRNWRNTPDQSTVAPPPFTTSQGSLPRTTNVPSLQDRNQYVGQPTYAPTYQPTYADPNAGYVQQGAPAYGQQQYGPVVGYQQQPIATVAARPDAQPLNTPVTAPQQPAGTWVPTVVNNQPVAAPAAPATAAPAAPAVAAAPTKQYEEPKSSWPLVLTSLALFASIGFNLWLGWLAWSFFWRYREAVTESARVRSHQVSSRQAA